MGHLVLSCCNGREAFPELPPVYLVPTVTDYRGRYDYVEEDLLLTSIGVNKKEWAWPFNGLTPAEALLLLTSPTLWIVAGTNTGHRGEILRLWEEQGKQVAPNPLYMEELNE